MAATDNKLAKHLSEVTLSDAKPGSRRAYNRAARRTSKNEIHAELDLHAELAANELSDEDHLDGPEFELAWGEPWSRTEQILAKREEVHRRAS